MEFEIIIPDELIEQLLIEAAEREVSVEEIMADAIQKFIERTENIAQ